jgi:hypothetical protein
MDILTTVARLLAAAARNPYVQGAALKLSRDATARLVRYVRNETRRRLPAGSRYWQ